MPGSLLDGTVESIHACGEDIEILESATYLDSVMYEREILQIRFKRIGLAYAVTGSLIMNIWC